MLQNLFQIHVTEPKQMKEDGINRLSIIVFCPLQVSSRLYPNNDQSNSLKYSLQSLSTPSHQESTTQSPFPKPIYSYR